jgi:hypothetical protein
MADIKVIKMPKTERGNDAADHPDDLAYFRECLAREAEASVAGQPEPARVERLESLEDELRRRYWFLPHVDARFFDTETQMLITEKGLNGMWYRHFPGGTNAPTASKVILGGEHKQAHGVGWHPVSAESFEMEGRTYVNTYRPRALDAVPGDVGPWLEIVGHAWGEYADLVLDHMAFTLQHPEIKIRWGTLNFGAARTGKSLSVLPLKEIFGGAGTSITPEQMAQGWGDLFAKRKVVMVEEVYQPDNKGFFNGLQVRLGNSSIEELNMKGQGFLKQQNLYSMYLFSNHENAMHLPKDSGKLLVVRGPDTKLPAELYKLVGEQVENDGPLLSHIKHFLLERDVSAFSYAVLPTCTEALEEMSINGMGEVARTVYDWASSHREIRDPYGHTTLADFRADRTHIRAEDVRAALLARKFKVYGTQIAEGLAAAGWRQVRGLKKVGGRVVQMPRGIWVSKESPMVTKTPREIFDWYAAIDPQWAEGALR